MICFFLLFSTSLLSLLFSLTFNERENRDTCAIFFFIVLTISDNAFPKKNLLIDIMISKLLNELN